MLLLTLALWGAAKLLEAQLGRAVRQLTAHHPLAARTLSRSFGDFTASLCAHACDDAAQAILRVAGVGLSHDAAQALHGNGSRKSYTGSPEMPRVLHGLPKDLRYKGVRVTRATAQYVTFGTYV